MDVGYELTCGSVSQLFVARPALVGAAEGCDLLILLLINKIKRSQPSAAPTEAVQLRR
jgi:hypothetical protein